MNAPFQTAEAVAAAIDALSVLYSNPDHVSKRAALRAVADGRAAYWRSSGYSNAAAGIFLDEANNRPALDTAFSLAGALGGTGPRSRTFLLSTLIPLNTKAIKALQQAIPLSV